MKVHVLEHIYGPEDYEERKLIGVYSSAEHVQEAIGRLKTMPGFIDYPDDFNIDIYIIDGDGTKGVYVLQHSYETEEYEESKLISVYSSAEQAQEAIGRQKTMPDFIDYPDGFEFEVYTLDEDNWKEGFVIVGYDTE